MNTKLLTFVILSLVVGAGLGYAMSMPQIMALQSSVSELESRTSKLSYDCNNLTADYKSLNESYVENAILIQSLQQQINNLNQSYLKLQQYEDLLFHYNLLNGTPTIYFDKSIYCPSAEVFWRPDVSVPIGLTVIDRNVDRTSATVKISSSVDSKEVTLAKVDFGVFMGTIFAVGLRLDEPISDTSSFNVRYGDVVITQYVDTLRGSIFMAGAFFGFPEYVLGKVFVSLDPWKLFDSEGVPLVNYGSPIGVQYNPVTVSQYALANYHLYVTTGNSTFRGTFLVQANWLVKTATQKDGFSVWEVKFDWPDYGQTNPFVSAMYQGQGLSVLIRAYVLTGNTTYLDLAKTAMGSFEVEMNSGGVRYTDSGGVWYEEYADVGAPSSKVLNGFIWALFGLYEYSFLTNSSKGYELFWEGTRTLSANLYRYDTGSWSYYDLLYRTPAPLVYHKYHIDQLRTMYELTSLETFLVYSNKFQSYIC